MFECVEAFHRPASVREALRLLRNGRGSARIIAGCTDVLAVTGDHADRSVRFLIDITGAGLSYVRRRGSAWAIGATSTMAELEASAEVCGLAGGILARAAAACGSIEIRNMATVGGNMANGSPAADLAAPLLALDASAVVANVRGRTKMPLAAYLASARTREMGNSILVEVTFADPPCSKRSGWSFQKFGRTAVDISVVNVAAGLGLDARGRVQWARIALGSVAPLPMRAPDAEALMVGRSFDRALLTEVSAAVMRAVRPIGDIRASAEYRREISGVLTERALVECASQAGLAI